MAQKQELLASLQLLQSNGNLKAHDRTFFAYGAVLDDVNFQSFCVADVAHLCHSVNCLCHPYHLLELREKFKRSSNAISCLEANKQLLRCPPPTLPVGIPWLGCRNFVRPGENKTKGKLVVHTNNFLLLMLTMILKTVYLLP